MSEVNQQPKSVKPKMPKIRFEGFSEDWEQGKLRTGVSRLIGGVSISPVDYLEKGRPTVPKGAINISGIADLSGIKYISEEFFQNNNKAVVLEDDLITCLRDLVPSGPNLARIVKIPKSSNQQQYLMPQGVYALKLGKNLVGSFLINLSNTYGFRNIVFREKNGTTQVHIRNDDFLNIKIKYPSTKEQTQIGNFFQELDKLIELQTRAVESAEAYKKAMLQKMFPKKGEKVPKVRFEGFSGDWKRIVLEELADIYDGTHQTPKYTQKGIKFLSVENILTLESDKYISPEDFYRDFKVYPQRDDILMTRIGSVGVVNIVKDDNLLAYYVSLALMKVKEYTSSLFLLSSIRSQSVQKEIWRRTLHIAFPRKINKGEIGKINIYLPEEKEQTKIGNYFQELDRNIESEKQKLEQYQTMKRAMLQRMFV